VRFSEQHAVEDILGLDTFDEGDLYKALDSLSLHQEEIEQKLYKTYLKNKGGVPTLVLFDVTSSYFEGEHNELAAFGYNRDGKKGKRYILMRNDAVYSKEEKRRDDKLKKLEDLIQKRNDFVKGSSRACAEGGMKTLQVWLKKYKMNTYITLSLTEKEISYHQNLEAQIKRPMLDGCYVIVTDDKKETLTATEVHRSYMQLQRVERDFRILKTGFLEVRPIFVRKKRKNQKTRSRLDACPQNCEIF